MYLIDELHNGIIVPERPDLSYSSASLQKGEIYRIMVTKKRP